MRKVGFVFGGMVALVLALGAATAADEKVPGIKQIMKTATGDTGLCAKCAKAGKDGKWEDAQKFGKSLSECCAFLPKNKAPKGDAEKWDKLAKEFADNGAAIQKATSDKDADALSKAVGTFAKACGTCHMEFKGKKKN
jgi:cytochrome c556